MIKPHRKLTGGEAAVKSLKKENVKHVFGLIGSATMEMFDALYHEKNIKFIGKAAPNRWQEHHSNMTRSY